jgi:hypothetical protein
MCCWADYNPSMTLRVDGVRNQVVVALFVAQSLSLKPQSRPESKACLQKLHFEVDQFMWSVRQYLCALRHQCKRRTTPRFLHCLKLYQLSAGGSPRSANDSSMCFILRPRRLPHGTLNRFTPRKPFSFHDTTVAARAPHWHHGSDKHAEERSCCHDGRGFVRWSPFRSASARATRRSALPASLHNYNFFLCKDSRLV